MPDTLTNGQLRAGRRPVTLLAHGANIHAPRWAGSLLCDERCCYLVADAANGPLPSRRAGWRENLTVAPNALSSCLHQLLWGLVPATS